MLPKRSASRRYENRTGPAGTSGWPGAINGTIWAMFATIAAAAVAVGIVNALSGAQDAAWRGVSYDIGRRLFWELSSLIVILELLPILMLAVRHMRQAPGLAVRIGIGMVALL